jgi:hypothetical protein
MNRDQQQQLPGVRIWTDVQTVPYGQLGPVIVQAAIDGFEAIRMDTIPGGYRLTFVKVAEETRSLSQPPEP